MKSCAVATCEYRGRYLKRGWCPKHYVRWRKHGDPLKTLRRENGSSPYSALLFHGYERVGECFLYKGKLDRQGYGHVGVNSKPVGAHRISYETWHGPIPEDFHIDHICHNDDAHAGLCDGGPTCSHRRCINPAHLEAVSAQSNGARSPHSGKGHPPRGMGAVHTLKTHCPRGHMYDDENTRIHHGSRECKTCAREKARERRYRFRAQGLTWDGRPRVKPTNEATLALGRGNAL